MKTYIERKQVKAEPMTESVAEHKGYARRNVNGHDWREGYHVVYENPDGSKYDSWAPKDVFESACRVAETFVDRMKIEHDELNDKCIKLDKFIAGDVYKTLSDAQKCFVATQLAAMKTYREVLAARMELCKQ